MTAVKDQQSAKPHERENKDYLGKGTLGNERTERKKRGLIALP